MWTTERNKCEICGKDLKSDKKTKNNEKQSTPRNVIKLMIPPPDSIVYEYDPEYDARCISLIICSGCVEKYFKNNEISDRYSEE